MIENKQIVLGVTPLELVTFGAVFTFAIGLEETAIQYYKAACEAIESPEVKTQCTSLQTGAIKRKKRVERIRRELVREAILVYVSGLDQNNYLIEFDSLQDKDDHQILEIALTIEKNNQRFYNDASTRIGHPDVTRAFQRLVKENSNRILKLEALM